MKIILNKGFGGFMIPDEICNLLHCEPFNICLDIRTNTTFIQWLEQKEDEGEELDLKIVEVPDNATDYTIEEFDGDEWIIYVVDGKLHSV